MVSNTIYDLELREREVKKFDEIVKNDPILKMIPENKGKTFRNYCLAEHPKKPLNQNDTSSWEKN